VDDGEAGGEDGVAFDAYSHVLPGMQERAVNAIIETLTRPYKRVASGIN
jgi:hypothetical protein